MIGREQDDAELCQSEERADAKIVLRGSNEAADSRSRFMLGMPD
ncbi:hypothetical protein [Catenulispora yoronensis]